MQDNSRQELPTGPFGLQHKVAIPRLARPERPPAKVQTKHRDRVTRACRNCHKRKVKCSGGVPRCNFCEKVDKPCVYEATRKDRLATATDRNEHLIWLLKDLSGRVDDEDRSRIEHALMNDSDDDIDSPGPSSAGGSVRFLPTSYSDQSRQPSRSQISPTSAFHTPDTGEVSPAANPQTVSGHQDSSYDVEFMPEDPTQVLDAHSVGHLGQICEVHWLRDLKSRVQRYGGSLSSFVSTKLGETNFYLDDQDIQLVEQPNPFYLPPEVSATVLFQCYFQTVHITFPIVSADIAEQLRAYYHSARRGESVHFPQRWFAIVHLVLAIGTRFSRLISAERQEDHNESVYVSSAFQHLGLHNTATMLVNPDLPLIQAYGLLAFYYMSIGHINRAWVTVGTALRFAVAFGLHTQAKSPPTNPQQAQIVSQTWWSLHNLESLLSSMTGRPCMLRSDDITTPLPGDMEEDLHQAEPFYAPAMSFPDAQVRLATITQEVLSLLYIRRRTPRSWVQMHAIITSMNSELDDWALEAMPQNREGAHTMPNHDMQQTMLRKQYCRVKILIARPSLRRIERCFEIGTEDYTTFDKEVAKTCIETAQAVVSLLPDETNIKLVYEKGPWWTIMHNIMQSLAVLLIAISCRPLFESSYADSVAGVRKLVTWLQYMSETNDTAKRAYLIIHDIIITNNLVDPFVWKDVVNMFANEHVPQPAQGHGQMDPRMYQSWTGEGPPPQRLFDPQDASEYRFYGVHSG